MGQTINGVLRRHGLVLAFLVFLAGVALNAEAFLTPGNILDVLRQVSITGMMALGVTLVVLTGRLDLSVGSLLTLLTVIVVDQHNLMGPFPAIVMRPAQPSQPQNRICSNPLPSQRITSQPPP